MGEQMNVDAAKNKYTFKDVKEKQKFMWRCEMFSRAFKASSRAARCGKQFMRQRAIN